MVFITNEFNYNNSMNNDVSQWPQDNIVFEIVTYFSYIQLFNNLNKNANEKCTDE